MNLLVACEESQVITIEARKRGHNAFSCDIINCSGGHPEWHIMQDVVPLLNGRCLFRTADGEEHFIENKWDMIIAHPPCTRLCNAGQRWLYWGDDAYREQKKIEQEEAVEFFMTIANADCDKIAIENPRGIMSTLYRKPDFEYNPYDFIGETECKTTCWWVKNINTLKPTRKVPLPKEERTCCIWRAQFNDKKYSWNDPETAKLRSKTPIGVAIAIGDQWLGQEE